MIAVPLPWRRVTGAALPDDAFMDELRRIPVYGLLPFLVRLLQHEDSPVTEQRLPMDRFVPRLFSGELARKAYSCLRAPGPWIFFSKWQLLLAIKLLCTFGSREQTSKPVEAWQALRLLLMVNSYYPDDPSPPTDDDAAVQHIQSVALRGFAIPHYERPSDLISRYAEIYGNLAKPDKKCTFRTWVDVEKVARNDLGFELEVFKAVMFGIFVSATPVLDSEDRNLLPTQFDPALYFSSSPIPSDTIISALSHVTVTPDQIREEHLTNYGDSIGNPVDVALLLRKPVIQIAENRLAGLSGELLVQKYTSGLYWDIHDALPNGSDHEPSREMFQNFFGELHERYGQSILQRVVERQTKAKRKTELWPEGSYPSGPGANPDSVLLEMIGTRNTRVTLFEFKVGRPQYQTSIVRGDIEQFNKDLAKKIETGLHQEIDLFRRLISRARSIPRLSTGTVTKWFFIIVVTDPFPAMGMFLDPLRERLQTVARDTDSALHGPYILSLSELEQLEALADNRVSELLLQWENSSVRDWPFNSFFLKRTNAKPLKFDRLAEAADRELQKTKEFLLPSF